MPVAALPAPIRSCAVRPVCTAVLLASAAPPPRAREGRGRLRARLAGSAALLLSLLAPRPAAAQPVDVRGEVFVGSEVERYLRLLQVSGDAPLYPWSLRGLSPREVDRVLPADSAPHPWAGRYRLHAGRADSAGAARRGPRVHPVRPRARLIYNSAFPFGGGDGAVWAGRGVTAAVEGGFAAEWGPVSLTVAPMAFVAQNAGFELMPVAPDAGPLTDPRYPRIIDLPQRFGRGRYARVDPGQSTLRVQALGVQAGVSTADQQWGPASDHPLLLGNNAGGMPHVFLGTAAPAGVGVGRIHGRAVWGTPAESAWVPDSAGGRRLFVGVVAAFLPRGIPGLEVGGMRLFHLPWDGGAPGARDLLKPVEGLFKARLDQDPRGNGNQLASVFFRWVHPRERVELWGEFARDDHSATLRDLVLEPDHASAFVLGGRKVWRREGPTLVSLRAEFLNARPTHLAQVREQPAFYVHSGVRQGHTHRGQLLGSPAAFAGAGSVVALDAYGPRGRWAVEWSRLHRDVGGDLLPTHSEPAVTHALSLERFLFLGAYDVGARVTGAYELNRNFTEDAFNLNLVLALTRGI